MSAMASQITSHTIVYSTVYSGVDQRTHLSSASLAFVWGIHRWPVASNAENVFIWWRHHAVWKISYFNSKAEVCSCGRYYQYVGICSDYGLEPIRRHAIIGTDDVIFCWRMYASLGRIYSVKMSSVVQITSVHFTPLPVVKVTSLDWSIIGSRDGLAQPIVWKCRLQNVDHFVTSLVWTSAN